MEMPNKGYTMPLSVSKAEVLSEYVVLIVCVLVFGFSYEEGSFRRLFIWFLLIPCSLYYLYRYFAQIHFIPQGIAITLWGRIFRKIPVSQIRFISAVRYTIKSRTYEKIVICTYDQDELTALYKKKTPKMFQNSREIWFGEWAGAELTRQATRMTWGLKSDSHILWLEWDCERLEALLRMYPNAQWLDCTQKKIFDERLNRR